MIVYRNQAHVVKSKDALASLCLQFRELERNAAPSHDAVERLFLEFGEFEAGLDDAVMGELALSCEESRTARRAAVALGRLLYRTLYGGKCEPWIVNLGRCFADLTSLLLPFRLRISRPEGYAYYGLYSQSYFEAAETFWSEKQPSNAVVIGIRSIGTSLSSVVAATLAEHGCRVETYTVRPSGHPWNRKLMVADTLEREWYKLRGSEFLIVDEGPGISGSSFASVAAKLTACGVPDSRITYFPSWNAPADGLSNAGAREAWKTHRICTASYSPIGGKGMRDLSAGAWRELSFNGDERQYPAVQPQHEARKHLTDSGVLLKFAGLGPYGEWKLAKQRTLAAAGFCPNALGFTNGYLASEYVEGRPLSAGDVSRELIDRIAEYLAFRSSAFQSEQRAPFETLFQMIEVNTAEALGRDISATWMRRLAPLVDGRPAIEIDGRMMPFEWISTARGILKTDAVDHHAGHFYPGPTDVAWDLAGAIIEFELGAADQRHLVDRYAALSGDRVPADLLRFYRIAYLAFRTGYSTMAASATMGTAEYARFSSLRLGYACMLQQEGFSTQSSQKVSA